MRKNSRKGFASKLVKKLYRDVLRPLDEPEGTDYIGPRLGRAKWLFHRMQGRSWACRDFWMLVVLDRQK